MRDDKDYEDYHHRHYRDGPFRFPIVPLLIAIILIILGISALLGINVWQYFWPVVAIIIGVLIIISIVFRRRRY